MRVVGRHIFGLKNISTCRKEIAPVNHAQKYEEVTGVSLKGEDDDLLINWHQPFSVTDSSEAAKRCFSKYRNLNPLDVSKSRLLKLLSDIKGFKKIGSEVDYRDHLEDILVKWTSLNKEEIERVTFEQLSSYEP